MQTLPWAGIDLATYGLREKRLDLSPRDTLILVNPPRVFSRNNIIICLSNYLPGEDMQLAGRTPGAESCAERGIVHFAPLCLHFLPPSPPLWKPERQTAPAAGQSPQWPPVYTNTLRCLWKGRRLVARSSQNLREKKGFFLNLNFQQNLYEFFFYKNNAIF